MNYHKKTVAFITSLLMCMSVAPMFSYAENEDSANHDDEIALINLDDENTMKESGDFSYSIDDDGNAHIESCLSDEDDITVPEEIDGIKVTEIEADAFMKGTYKKITIPASVEYISAENPFAPCIQLTEIAVDKNNKNYCSVDGVIFTKDMKKLICYPAEKSGTSYTIPDGTEKIGIASFYEANMKEIILPDSLNEISRHAFSYMANLEKIDMSETSVQIIDTMTFAECVSLNEVIFSESTLEIGLASFYGCNSLTEVTLPSALTTVGQSAFMGTGLTKIRIPDSVASIGYSAFGYDTDEKADPDFVIIGSYSSGAFTYATDSDSDYDYANNFKFVTTEEADAEEEYQAMNPIASGDYEYSVVDGEACILLCESTDEIVTVPEEIDGYKVTSIYKYAFIDTTAKNIIFPETVKTIGANMFSEYVESITIPSSCTAIEGDEPFLSCASLREIIVTEGGDGEYSSLDGVLYNKDKTVLIAYPVQKSDTEFKVPSSVTDIAISAFCHNVFLENVDLSGVKNIGSCAFEDCVSLKSVKFSDDLDAVGNGVFIDTPSLMSVRLPSSLEIIGEYTFGYYYDASIAYQQTGEETLPYSVVDGFKIYAEEDSLAWEYAQACGIEVITNTVGIGKKNIDRNFLYVIGGSVGAVILAVAGVSIGKSIKRKKGRKV
ncbi:MAG: leucine-rich repeat domain-containing protein [Ruminococcus sp.]|nr:leucine-rich repeat domain-containing protein [Ruminococcus sp.]